jgi:hypothetical protein
VCFFGRSRAFSIDISQDPSFITVSGKLPCFSRSCWRASGLSRCKRSVSSAELKVIVREESRYSNTFWQHDVDIIRGGVRVAGIDVGLIGR